MTRRVVKRVLVPTDFSKLSLAALEYAGILIELQGPTFYLLHVLDKKPPRKSRSVKKNSEKVFKDEEKNVSKQLSAFAKQYLSKYTAVKVAVRRGEPHQEIVKFVQEQKIDLILLSTHGRTGILHVLMGSVAEKVVRYSPVPVLSVKPMKVQASLMDQEDVEEQLHLRSVKIRKNGQLN